MIRHDDVPSPCATEQAGSRGSACTHTPPSAAHSSPSARHTYQDTQRQQHGQLPQPKEQPYQARLHTRACFTTRACFRHTSALLRAYAAICNDVMWKLTTACAGRQSSSASAHPLSRPSPPLDAHGVSWWGRRTPRGLAVAGAPGPVERQSALLDGRATCLRHKRGIIRQFSSCFFSRECMNAQHGLASQRRLHPGPRRPRSDSDNRVTTLNGISLLEALVLI